MQYAHTEIKECRLNLIMYSSDLLYIDQNRTDSSDPDC